MSPSSAHLREAPRPQPQPQRFCGWSSGWCSTPPGPGAYRRSEGVAGQEARWTWCVSHFPLVGGLGREDSSRQVVSFGTPPGRRRTRHRPYRHRVRFTFDARRADRGADISVVRNRGAGNGNRGEQGRRSSFMTEVGAGVDGGLGIASRLLTEYPSRSGWLLGPPSLGRDPGETRTHGSPAPVAGSGRRGRIPRGVAGGCGASCGASTAGYTRPRAAACRSTRLPTPGRHHGRGCQVELPCTDVEEMLFDLFLCRQLRGD